MNYTATTNAELVRLLIDKYPSTHFVLRNRYENITVLDQAEQVVVHPSYYGGTELRVEYTGWYLYNGAGYRGIFITLTWAQSELLLSVWKRVVSQET
jgi:hypothetical protein